MNINQKLKERLLKSLTKFSQKYHVLPASVAYKVCLEIKEEDIPLPAYMVLENYRKKEYASIQQILSIPKVPGMSIYIDPEQYADIVPGFIIAALWWCIEQYNIEPLKVGLVFTNDGKTVYMHLYDGPKLVKQNIEPETLFNHDILMAYAQNVMP